MREGTQSTRDSRLRWWRSQSTSSTSHSHEALGLVSTGTWSRTRSLDFAVGRVCREDCREVGDSPGTHTTFCLQWGTPVAGVNLHCTGTLYPLCLVCCIYTVPPWSTISASTHQPINPCIRAQTTSAHNGAASP